MHPSELTRAVTVAEHPVREVLESDEVDSSSLDFERGVLVEAVRGQLDRRLEPLSPDLANAGCLRALTSVGEVCERPIAEPLPM